MSLDGRSRSSITVVAATSVGFRDAVSIAARVWLPGQGAIHVPWLVPSLEGVLLVVLVTRDPSSPAERRALHRAALVLVGVLVAAALWATVLLVSDLINDTGVSRPGSIIHSG